MERSTDYKYLQVICDDPRKYCKVLRKIYKALGWEAHVAYSRTSSSCYITLDELNERIRIADHTRMAWPPYANCVKQPWWKKFFSVPKGYKRIFGFVFARRKRRLIVEHDRLIEEIKFGKKFIPTVIIGKLD